MPLNVREVKYYTQLFLYKNTPNKFLREIIEPITIELSCYKSQLVMLISSINKKIVMWIISAQTSICNHTQKLPRLKICFKNCVGT